MLLGYAETPAMRVDVMPTTCSSGRVRRGERLCSVLTFGARTVNLVQPEGAGLGGSLRRAGTKVDAP